MRRSPTPPFIGVLQALIVVGYVLLLGRATTIGGYLSVVPDARSYLLLFSFSVMFCASLVFAYPVYLLILKRFREAFIVFASTLVSMGVLIAYWMLYYSVTTPSYIYVGF